MRDILIVSIVLAGLPVGLFRPYLGLLLYAWISYMNPHMYAWSFGQTFPVGKISALAVCGGYIFAGFGNVGILRHRENILMIVLLAVFTLSTLFAIYPDQAWAQWQDVTKLIVMSLMASILIRNPKQLRNFTLVIALSLGFYGFKGGLFGLATRGNEMVLGPGNSIIGANNAIGLALNMVLPFCWYMASQERGWLRRILLATFFLTIPAILFTYSRASALTAGVVIIAIILKHRYRFVMVPAILIVAMLAVPFLPEKWVNRQRSTLEYEQDGSAMSRLDNWKFCWRVAMDRPLTGAGFSFQSTETFARYAPEFLYTYRGKVWDTHNIYFSILACHGFIGLAVFVVLIGSCLMSCFRCKRLSRRRPELQWMGTYCDIVQVSFLAFLVNGFFVNMEYFDLVYHLISIIVILKEIASRTMTKAEETAPSLDQVMASPATA